MKKFLSYLEKTIECAQAIAHYNRFRGGILSVGVAASATVTEDENGVYIGAPRKFDFYMHNLQLKEAGEVIHWHSAAQRGIEAKLIGDYQASVLPWRDGTFKGKIEAEGRSIEVIVDNHALIELRTTTEALEEGRFWGEPLMAMILYHEERDKNLLKGVEAFK
jgi:hypothetical protein